MMNSKKPRKKKEADKKWTIIQKVLTEDVGINCLRVSKDHGNIGDFVAFSVYPLSLDDNGSLDSSSSHYYVFDIDSMFKTLTPIINATADKKQEQIDEFINNHLSREIAEIKDLDYISPNLSMRHVPDKYRERLRKKQREVTLPYTDEKAQ